MNPNFGNTAPGSLQPDGRSAVDIRPLSSRPSGGRDWNILLQDAVVKNMEKGAVFARENRGRVNSLDFHRSAELLVGEMDWIACDCEGLDDDDDDDQCMVFVLCQRGGSGNCRGLMRCCGVRCACYR